MLYYIFQWLDKYDFPGAGMFGYTSFRSLMAIILALLISSIWGDKFINLLKRKQITETQRDANIDPFGVNKVGVPSMGGVIIIFAILIPCLLLGKLSNIYMILMLITTIWLGSTWLCRRLHQDIQKRQGRAARQVQNHRSSRFRTYRRTDSLPQSAGGYPREHRNGEVGRTDRSGACRQRNQGNPNHHPILQKQ